jgi:hypothetical protein
MSTDTQPTWALFRPFENRRLSDDMLYMEAPEYRIARNDGQETDGSPGADAVRPA